MVVMTLVHTEPVDTGSTASISFPPPESARGGGAEHAHGSLRALHVAAGRSSIGGPTHTPGRLVQSFPIQRAKVHRPPLRAATLTRQRLTTWLDDHINHRVVSVTAEAGGGKEPPPARHARPPPKRGRGVRPARGG